MKKLTYAKDEEESSKDVIIKQSYKPPIPWEKTHMRGEYLYHHHHV